MDKSDWSRPTPADTGGLPVTMAMYPVMAAPGRVRVWLGVTQQTSAPVPAWKVSALDGAVVPRTLEVIRPMSPVRGAIPPSSGTTRTFSGLFEFVSDVPVRVEARIGQERAQLVTRPVPATFETFRFLLASCYCRDEDPGALGRAARFVATRFRPDATLLMGDQVYLDIPTLSNFPEKNPALLDMLERNYTRSWLPDGAAEFTFADLLSVAPALCLPDDHEYWNNAPHPSPFIQNSWTAAGRAVWRRNADMLFDAFQNGSATPGAPATRVDVGPISLLALNGRTHRQEDLTASFSPAALTALDGWNADLRSSSRFPLFLTGQSMLDLPSSTFSGATADYMQSNYRDFPRVMGALDALAKERADVLLLTGDVHFGRVSELTPTASLGTQTRLYEVISSPSTLVTTVGADGWARARNWLEGGKDRWPRHSQTPDLASVLRLPGFSYSTRTTYPHRGDQLCVLELTRAPNALDVTAHYIDVGSLDVTAAPTFRLRRRTA